VLKALSDVAGTKVAELILENAGSRAFSDWVHLMALQRVQYKSVLNRGAPNSVKVLVGEHRSNAAWLA
jgi:hypothetical protein